MCVIYLKIQSKKVHLSNHLYWDIGLSKKLCYVAKITKYMTNNYTFDVRLLFHSYQILQCKNHESSLNNKSSHLKKSDVADND